MTSSLQSMYCLPRGKIIHAAPSKIFYEIYASLSQNLHQFV